MPAPLREHWPEYLMEAAELAFFLIAACAAVVLLEHPDSPVPIWLPSPHLRRVATGAAMGLTAVAIIYSPWGKRSGAHFNPAVTLTYAALGKVRAADASFYIASHFAGAAIGVAVAAALFGDRLAHPSVGYIATVPGDAGAGVAFAAELAISFLLMTMVLALSRRPAMAPYTGLFAGAAVAVFISVEAPLSGMSMNPARSFGPAAIGETWDHLWIYFTAPPLGMLLAGRASRRLGIGHCAKLVHASEHRCIFCGWPGAARARPRAARRFAGRHVAAVLVALLATGVDPTFARSAPATAVGAIAITVSDVDRSTAFYTEVLGFEEIGETEVWGEPYERLQGVFGLRTRTVRLRLGGEQIELVQYLTPTGRPIPIDSRSHDHWFQHIAIIVSDMDRAFAHLRARRVRFASPAPQTLPEWNPDAGGIRAFYFKDPDGHSLEVLQFPPGKGRARWHRPTDELFLGIDHTAIVVADTDASLRFYRDTLGLRVAGTSENHGAEQERLNNVFGARLRITALRAGDGPGIELLEYLTPADGRPIPGDQAANDIAHWETALHFPAIDDAAAELRAARAVFVSPGVVALPAAPSGPLRAFLARDPDGHVVRAVEVAR